MVRLEPLAREDLATVDELRRGLTQIQSLDGSLKDQYDNAVTTIRQYGAIMSGSAPGDPAEALSGLRAFTATLTAKLRDEGRQVREVKNSIVRGRATPK